VSSVFDSEAFNDRLFFPRRDQSRTPSGGRDLFVDVPGARLHLRRHAARTAPIELLLFHGNGEVVADYDEAAVEFLRAGASLSVVDYRGYGQSSGTPSLRTLVADAQGVLAALGGERPVVVMGRSLGSAAAAELYGAASPAMVGVILESGFSDLRGLVDRRGLESPLRFSDEELAAFDHVPKLRRGTLPLLVLHGEDDELIDVGEARTAYAEAGAADKTLVVIPSHGHNDVALSPRYWAALAAFLAARAPK
jgi:pimeloyl-ACP methyl ester carboxylesterase